jgi:L-seryl-tRNA(Ser) seleniumtransferase
LRGKPIPPERAAGVRKLSSVSGVLAAPAALALIERFGRPAATEAIRARIDEARGAILAGLAEIPSPDEIASQAFARLEQDDVASLRPLFNLSGIVLHTNLGRALLADVAIEAALAAMRHPVALEFDLATGKRGERDDHLRDLLIELTGAEDATVVNNNAAAVLLALNSLARGREAIVSRGELIEIGGAFRMPDIMEQAGVRLIEVGTTNRTHEADYQRALRPETGVILKVHRSNYVIQGFTKEVTAPDLARIADAAGVPLMNDLGSGTLIDLSRFGLQWEPTVGEAVAEGAGLVTFSGDKLLGGPQAGFIVGRKDLIARINQNPMKRAFRVDKMRLAAIAATLKLYRDPERLADRLPTLRLLTRSKNEIAAQAERILPALAATLGAGFTVTSCDCASQIGSGALPLDMIPSAGLAIAARDGGGALDRLAADFRALPWPVIGRTHAGLLTLDLRCLTDEPAFLANLALLAKNGGEKWAGLTV